LGLALFNTFVGDMDSGIKCNLSKFADDTKMSCAVDTLEGKDAIQRDLDRLERWACVNLMKFNKVKCKVLHPGRGNPWYQYRLADERIECSPEEKDLGLSVDMKLNTTRQHVLAAQKVNQVLGCIKRNVARQGEGGNSAPLPCSGETPPGVLCPALEPPARHGGVGAGAEEATKMIRGMEHLSYEERVRELGLFSLQKRRLQGDLTAAFQYPKGAYKKDEEGLFTRARRDMTWGNGFKLKKSRVR